MTQQDNGADILDVNVGLPEIDEPSMMEAVVKELQAVIDLPLQIDTSIHRPWSGPCGFITERL